MIELKETYGEYDSFTVSCIQDINTITEELKEFIEENLLIDIEVVVCSARGKLFEVTSIVDMLEIFRNLHNL